MTASTQLQALRSLLGEQGFGKALPASQLKAYPPTPTGIAELDALLGGGLPRGQISEVVGAASSGCTRLVLSVLAEATRAGEVAAYIDATDCLDPRSAEQAGVVLDRLLWVRCANPGHERVGASLKRPPSIVPQPQQPRYEPLLKQTRVDQTWQALNLVAAGGFGVIVLDAGGLPRHKLRQWQGYQWLRPKRVIEHSPTALLLMSGEHLAGSASTLVLELSREKTHWKGASGVSLLLDGISTSIRLAQQRRRAMTAGA
jgi:recombination protein RecA